MEPGAIPTDGTEGKERRTTKLTEKGEEHFRSQVKILYNKVRLSSILLSESIENAEPLPQSPAALDNIETTLHSVFQRYDACANDYLDFLSHSRVPEAAQELEQYWPIMTDLKKRYNNLLEKIYLKKELVETRSRKSSMSKVSKSVTSSSSTAASKRAKAESEKVKLKFVEKEIELKKTQYEKALELEILEQQKIAAAADAEASYLEKHSHESEEGSEQSVDLPKEELSPFDKTLNFLNGLSSPAHSVHVLSPKAVPFVPVTNDLPTILKSSTPGIYHPTGYDQPLSAQKIPDHSVKPTMQINAPSVPPQSSLQDTSNFLIKKNILLESFQQQQFEDRPDRYITWKTQFKTMVADIKCTPLEEISLLSNCINKDSDAHRLVMSARSSCASDPFQCLNAIWARMDERFGSAELLESALKNRLMDLPDLTDGKQLYALHDLLTEIVAAKNLSEYSAIFSYLDSSLGIRPIIQKLPRALQEKWITRVVNFKKKHSVIFPPFTELVAFIGEMSIIRNDPGLIYETPKEQSHVSRNGKRNRTVHVTTRKTNVSPEKSGDPSHLCLIHKGSKHTINECRAFQGRTIENRKALLRDNNICFRCCETSKHFAKKCQAKLCCDLCQSNFHCTALHPFDPSNKPSDHSPSASSAYKHGEESHVQNLPKVNSNCLEICGKPNFTGKSCARILPVRVYPEGQPDNFVMTYCILDDQSNRTLGRTLLFDSLGVKSVPIEYLLQSCSGKTINFGRTAEGLIVESVQGTQSVHLRLPPVLECDDIPDNHTEIPTPEVARCYPHMRDIAKYLHTLDRSMQVLLLIGRDLPEAHHTLDQRIGPPGTPFAKRSPLGWTIIGDVCLSGHHVPSSVVSSDKIFVSDNGRPTTLEPCIQTVSVHHKFVSSYKTHVSSQDIFQTTSVDNLPGLSIEDRKFLDIMDREFHLNSEGRWTAPLPFRLPREPIPDNYQMALRRAKSLDASLHSNEVKKSHFLAFMQKILDSNHAELAPYLPPEKERWYLPLFGVYHPRKPDQIRGVFDASAKYEGISLNDQLLQGPDFINNLLGILIRFRKGKIAVVADIQQMFHSFLVDEKHRDFLRFLWHRDNVLENPLVIYRMRVHVFGNRPSPAVAMYGLQRIGELAAKTHGLEIKDFICNDFYVDDGLKSCPTEHAAVDLIQKTQDAMKVHGNLRLHKFASNSKEVMDAFDSQDLAKSLIELDFEKDTPTQRSLGLLWDLKSDTFRFGISEEDKPITRRGILSAVNSLYDPLGFLSPVTINGKIILRKIVASTLGWDDPLPIQLVREWEAWKSALFALRDLQIPRVMVPDFDDVARRELMVYCDASELAIAAVCYLKATYQDGSTSSGFVLGKAKVAPLSANTIPRLELCAAVLAVEVAQVTVNHLGAELDNITFFSDSRVVLGYINNETKRFFTYVANRVVRIRTLSKPSQWMYIRSEINPADVSTRGIQPRDMQTCVWLQGPKALSSSPQLFAQPVETEYPLIDPDVDNEVRCDKLDVTQTSSVGLDNGRFVKFSKWERLIFALVCIRKYIQRFKSARSACFVQMNDADLYLDTERVVISDVQRNVYHSEISNLKSSKPLHKSSPLFMLDPYIDASGLLRVGGRLKRSNFDPGFKNPIILPSKHHIATLICRKGHCDVKHQGRHITEGRVRSSGYWIVGGKKLITSMIYNCVTCRRLRKDLDHQKMSDLPAERVLPGYPPFSFIGVDVFGPWEIVTRKTRGGSANSKRWAALFTCLITRAVHIEVLEDMTASTFINALRRFVAVRGCVRVIRSDRGTNFVGAANELGINTVNVEDGPVHDYLTKQGTTWIFNPPHASHMGGVWERMIGTTRRILDSMLLEYGSGRLTHDVLTTFLAEACSIINSRPLVPVSSDPDSPFILTPSTLLTQKSDSVDVSYLNSDADKKDLLCKQWKRVQHLASVFWKRWKVEYMNALQHRRKWNVPQCNVRAGDVVLVRDKDLYRNEWPIGLVIETVESDDGLVRKVLVRVAREGIPKTYVRPVNELVLLVPC